MRTERKSKKALTSTRNLVLPSRALTYDLHCEHTLKAEEKTTTTSMIRPRPLRPDCVRTSTRLFGVNKDRSIWGFRNDRFAGSVQSRF